MGGSPTRPFPNGALFAFTVVDDTDVATLENIRPLYDLLHSLGMRTTKTVWPLAYRDGKSNFADSDTLEDPEYVEYIRELARRGFEITWHGPTMESSTRDRVIAGLERYRAVFGEYPRIHVNHSHNADNLYWGRNRFDSVAIRMILDVLLRRSNEYSQGHQQGSPYWWGDRAHQHFEYARNLTTNDINTASFNPSMPYRDPARPLVPWWFSSSDAEAVHEFNELISPANQEKLEAERGFCIVATHFGKGFVDANGHVNSVTKERLEMLAKRRGWFPTTGELLNWLRDGRSAPADGTLPRGEWRRMQWRWLSEVVARKLFPPKRAPAAR